VPHKVPANVRGVGFSRKEEAMPVVKVRDINMHYETYGTGEPLMLLPGLGAACKTCFFRQIPRLAEEFRVIGIDNRGSGLSDKPETGYSVETMADDAAELLASLDIHRAHILGLSMGGMIAQHMALRHPEKVVSLMLVCTSCGGSHVKPADWEVVSRTFDMKRRTELPHAERLRADLPLYMSQQFIDTNPDIIDEFVLLAVKYAAPPHSFMRQADAVIMHDTYDRLSEIKVPTLVIGGGNDRLQHVDNARLLAERIRNAELMVLQGMDHYLFVEAADDLSDAVIGFLKRNPMKQIG
jgi:3-oxoadipate enol-lactonase